MSAGSDLCKSWEKCAVIQPDGSVKAYWDKIAGVWTIGWGSTGAAIGSQTVWSQAQCDDWFDNVWRNTRAGVLRASPLLSAPENLNRLEAICCFAYNCGVGAYQTSTMRRYVNAGRWTDAANEFPKWCHSKGKRVQGLVNRRASERILFLRTIPDDRSSPSGIQDAGPGSVKANRSPPSEQGPLELQSMMQQFERMIAEFLQNQNRP